MKEAFLRHVDLGNDEPKYPTTGNSSTFRSDVMLNVQGVDKVLNAGGVFHRKTSQFPSLNSLHSIYLEESMTDLSQESNHELLKL